MAPTICRCCGLLIGNRAPANPNVCAPCAAGVVNEAEGEEAGQGAAPGQLDDLLEIDGPSVLECYNAAADAEQAIKEEASQHLESSAEAVPKPVLQIKVPPS